MGAKVQLRGARALVTGAGAGIGRETVLALAGAGASVVVTDIDGDAAEAVAKEVAKEVAGDAEAHRLDVTDAVAVADLAARLQPVDVAVANAGVGMSGRMADMTLEDWRWIRSINLDGVIHTAHAFGPPMVARGRGHVVLVASGLAYTPRATEAAYCTTKAAVLALAQCLRADWGSRGVGVSAVCPGIIKTGILDGTRFLGGTSDEAVARKVFSRGHRPALVAKEVLRAVEGDKALVMPGVESKIGWYGRKILPLAVSQFVARQGLR